MFRQKDIALLEQRGISVEQATRQMERFVTGFPWLEIEKAARPGEGITVLTPEQEDQAIARWHDYLANAGEVFKFVPASGAASRMFKALFEFIDSDSDTPAPGSPVSQVLDHIDEFAFVDDLRQAVMNIYGDTLEALRAKGRNRDIIAAVIKPEGLNYGALPKALLKFHIYPDSSRTPLEEQLAEGAQTAAASDGVVKLHFTVSANHRKLFEQKLAEAIPAAEARTGLKFNVSLSEQKPSTDTIAANPDNTPFLEDDNLLLRPGGHGALIENLNDIDSAVVFIKNIDNVVPDWQRDPTVRYKKVIGGWLITVHDRIEAYLRALEAGDYTPESLGEMVSFMRTVLCIESAEMNSLEGADLAAWIKTKLDRPLRVCGMVRNEGEPGGGPYIARNPDGSFSPQVLESNQIRPEYKDMMAKATHFNPVDLVCYIKDINGKKYDLPAHVDPATGFISSKSSHGKELKAMELPGLWNGAMSDWNTVFVEVPLSTFNPVKTVNDLLRPVHRP
nr:DUF4301 family protein [Bacteroides sp.]